VPDTKSKLFSVQKQVFCPPNGFLRCFLLNSAFIQRQVSIQPDGFFANDYRRQPTPCFAGNYFLKTAKISHTNSSQKSAQKLLLFLHP
jgi:hypothetical protein